MLRPSQIRRREANRDSVEPPGFEGRGRNLRLDKKDEAVTEYNAVLKFDPTDDQKKAANKALHELQ